MKGFEQFPQPKGEEMPLIETGSRPSIYKEGKSHFDEKYDAMLDALQASGDSVLGDFVEALSSSAKIKLGAALNENGRDWGILATIGKENSPAVITKITEWEDIIEIAADARAVRNANRTLADALEDL